MKDFLERIPEPFAIELLQALPGPDRKELLRNHNAKVKVTAGNLKRAVRMAKEARLLVSALKGSSLDAQRTFLQGWLARRAEMIVHFLTKWEVAHTNGIVEDFEWVQELTVDQVKASMEGLEEGLEPVAPLIYFAYLELPFTADVLDLDDLFSRLQPVAKD